MSDLHVTPAPGLTAQFHLHKAAVLVPGALLSLAVSPIPENPAHLLLSLRLKLSSSPALPGHTAQCLCYSLSPHPGRNLV